MEWVETTAKTVDEAKEQALDQLGVAADDAEFEVVEEPKSGLFGRLRGEARVRARVQPATVRPKQERRQRGRNKQRDKQRGAKQSRSDDGGDARSTNDDPSTDDTPSERDDDSTDSKDSKDRSPRTPKQQKRQKEQKEQRMDASDVTPQEVGDAAVAFMDGLTSAFGVDDAETILDVDGTDLDVRVEGSGLGLMVGPGGRTLTAIQDLARVASQRRLGDHDTRLRIDIGGYREKRKAALEKFAQTVAQQVVDTGEAKALEPMSSSDRKIVHDTIIEIDGVTSRSEGDDPRRRVVITPA